MKWEKVKLGDICKYVTSGGTPKSSIKEYYEPKQIPWLKTKEVNYCRIYETESYISKDGLDNSSAKMIPQNSVIVAMYGQGDTAGRVAINKIPLTTNQACCNLIIDETKACYEFVYYQLVTLYEKMVSLKNGGAQPNLNAAIIKSMEIKLPPLKTQRYIADILSSYDDLIENNQKQIKLLEEAAQRLYKEWFVDLRFPGHENTKIVDGVPEGWRKFPLEEIAPVVTGKKDANYGDKGGNYPFFTCSQETITAPGYSFDTSAVILAGNGDFNVKLYRGKFEAYQRTYVLAPFDHSNLFNLYFTVQNNMEALAKGASGSTIKFLTKGMLQKILVLTADKKILDKFNDYEENIQQKVEALKKQVEDLTEIRNRLLPKLMSGEVEV
jgi:type I restriction enzyme S subunit